jgi:hypothetical protein
MNTVAWGSFFCESVAYGVLFGGGWWLFYIRGMEEQGNQSSLSRVKRRKKKEKENV